MAIFYLHAAAAEGNYQTINDITFLDRMYELQDTPPPILGDRVEAFQGIKLSSSQVGKIIYRLRRDAKPKRGETRFLRALVLILESQKVFSDVITPDQEIIIRKYGKSLKEHQEKRDLERAQRRERRKAQSEKRILNLPKVVSECVAILKQLGV